MATTSTVPTVRAALVDLIETALPGVQVSYGRPPSAMKEREGVWLADLPSGDRTVPVMNAGRRVREETYTLEVVVVVKKPRGTVRAAYERARELFDAIENAIADDFTVGDLDVVHVLNLGSFREEIGYSDEGPVCMLVEPLRITARLN